MADEKENGKFKPRTNKKGFLEQQGYSPESMIEPTRDKDSIATPKIDDYQLAVVADVVFVNRERFF